MATWYTQRSMRIGTIIGLSVFLAYVLIANGQGGFTFATSSGTGTPGLELKIDAQTFYNGVEQPTLSWDLKDLVPGVDRFWNFGDVKPGDTGTSSISIHIEQNPAYVCLDFTNLSNDENGMNEPESLLDPTPFSGELASGLEFFAWRDDGDNRFELGEEPLFGTSSQSALSVMDDTTYALADSATGLPYPVGSTHYVGIYWCAGDLSVNLAAAQVTCNGKVLGNEAQTDSMSVDIRVRAIQSVGNSGFRCDVPPAEECVVERGNNGHGNDADQNDDSNPGASNDPADATDEDGLPPGFAKRVDGAPNASGLVNCKPKGNNGHGNDADQNDDSNPGASNDPDDATDDDGLPPGQQRRVMEEAITWQMVEKPSLFAQASTIGAKLLGKAKKQ